jgi:hypothetical protein
MTSETVISLSSRLWDVIFASFKTDYATMEAVRKTFPRVENHTLAFWGGLVSAGDDGSQELMKHLVENRLVRASLTNSARLGESCALHAEGVASRYRPFMSPTICFLFFSQDSCCLCAWCWPRVAWGGGWWCVDLAMALRSDFAVLGFSLVCDV